MIRGAIGDKVGTRGTVGIPRGIIGDSYLPLQGELWIAFTPIYFSISRCTVALSSLRTFKTLLLSLNKC